MALSERARDWLITAAFLVAVGALLVVGWVNRQPSLVLARGAPAPPLTLDRIDGGTLSLEAQRGQVVLLNIWATWCAPCRREMPSMQQVYERYRDEGLQIVAVAVDDAPGERTAGGRIDGVVSEFVERYGLTFPVVVDSTGETERRLGVSALPTTFLLDREGRIRAREVGGRYWDREPYVDMIESLLEE